MPTPVIILFTIAVSLIGLPIYLCYCDWKMQVKQQVKKIERKKVRFEEKKRHLETFKSMQSSGSESYRFMIIFGCYVEDHDIGMYKSETTNKFVFVCRDVGDFGICKKNPDWVVYYEPRRGLSAYSDSTRQIISRQSGVKTLRLSCGCYRDISNDRRLPGLGGLNCSCSNASNQDLLELKDCWLQDRDPAQYHLSKMKDAFGNRNNFIQDVRRLRFSVSE